MVEVESLMDYISLVDLGWISAHPPERLSVRLVGFFEIPPHGPGWRQRVDRHQASDVAQAGGELKPSAGVAQGVICVEGDGEEAGASRRSPWTSLH